jgi:hypothetical protein
MSLCIDCGDSAITHSRKKLCSICYKNHRHSQWYLNDIKRCNNKLFLEKRKQYKANYFQKNKIKLSNINKKYEYSRLKNDVGFKLRKILRKRLTEAVKNNHKSGSAVRDLGCLIPELKIHLEFKFTEGMTWGNYGKWHIDHIRPLSSFNLTNPNELKTACHYTNLQPLWAKDNLTKSNKYE